MTEDSNRAPSSNPAGAASHPQAPSDEANHTNWKDLAERASHETNPQKLLTLVKDLCSALDSENKPPVDSQSVKSNSADDTPQQRSSST
jgi:hypothetical protein